jgi:hypothetical protein
MSEVPLYNIIDRHAAWIPVSSGECIMLRTARGPGQRAGPKGRVKATSPN